MPPKKQGTVVVTGGSSGIGVDTVSTLALLTGMKVSSSLCAVSKTWREEKK